jgi:hypothetical protein
MLYDRLKGQKLGSVWPATLLTCPLKTENTLEVYRQLYFQNIPAVPIVDSRKKLVGTLSASDLVGIDRETLHKLDNPLINYLENNYDYLHPSLGKLAFLTLVLKKSKLGHADYSATCANVLKKVSVFI